jgi:hypothetical protein
MLLIFVMVAGCEVQVMCPLQQEEKRTLSHRGARFMPSMHPVRLLPREHRASQQTRRPIAIPASVEN